MSVLYFQWIQPEARVVAFEPDPATFEILRRTVEGNGLAGVEPRCEAVGGVEEMVDFHYLENFPGWLTQSAVMRASAEAEMRQAPMVTLSPLIRETVDLLKIDDCLSQLLAVLARNGFGYMLSPNYRTPFRSGEFQGLMIAAYRQGAQF